MFYDGGFMMGGGLHGLGWLLGLVLIGAIVWLAWRRPGADTTRETPQQVLQRRLANGEITPEQYEQRKALLDRDRGA